MANAQKYRKKNVSHPTPPTNHPSPGPLLPLLLLLQTVLRVGLRYKELLKCFMVLETSRAARENNGNTAGRALPAPHPHALFFTPPPPHPLTPRPYFTFCTLLVVAKRFRAFRVSGFCGVFLQRDFILPRRVPHTVRHGSDG